MEQTRFHNMLKLNDLDVCRRIRSTVINVSECPIFAKIYSLSSHTTYILTFETARARFLQNIMSSCTPMLMRSLLLLLLFLLLTLFLPSNVCNASPRQLGDRSCGYNADCLKGEFCNFEHLACSFGVGMMYPTG